MGTYITHEGLPFHGALEKIRIRSCRVADLSLPGFDEKQLLEITRDGTAKLTQKTPEGTKKAKTRISQADTDYIFAAFSETFANYRRKRIPSVSGHWRVRLLTDDDEVYFYHGANGQDYRYHDESLTDILRQRTGMPELFGLCVKAETKNKVKSIEISLEQTAADEVKDQKDELGITCSIGVSWNKVFAKLGSDYKKPNATTIISRSNWKDIVFPLPATDLLYVGSRTGKKLSNYCIHTIGDLATANPNFLKEKLGKIGPMLWGFANGLDTGAVAKYEGREAQAPIKSIGNSWTTPRDLKTDRDVWIVIYLLAESVAARLRENHFRCRGVEVSLRDSSLFSFERQVKLSQPTMQEKDIAEAAYQLYKKNYRWSEHLRSVGVRAIDLRPDTEPNQISFEYSAEKQEETERLESAIDGIRNRFGYYSVQRAVMYKDRFLSHCDAKGDHTIHPHGYLQGSTGEHLIYVRTKN